ncbi:hypothetical protein [Streptomyces sp. 8L]|uniref:hypothetical protein n=1 Tax=Streptomyces sp. 8L TaxID=2877242 RepID=UPI001CD2B866|nr:hypothetical protein [Streptomyces sp. 8L]MCA1222244.1 hypothetical protein [Streptomyces sp. 8L]
MTALLDTRRALEEQVTALGDRVEISRREITETVTSQVSELRADNRETRNRVNSASTSLSEINKSLPGLRQDVADLARVVYELRATVGDLFARLPESPSVVENPDREQPLPTEPPEPPEPVQPEQGRFADPRSPQEPDTAAPVDEDAETGSAAVSEPGRPGEGAEPESATAQRQAATEAAASAHPGTEGESAKDGLTAVQSRRADHDIVLRRAATVGTVHVVCHRDMWDFIQEHAADIPHFRAPATPSEEGHDRLRITLSGRSLIGVLIGMSNTRTKSAEYGKDDGTWALSGAVYERLAHDLTTTSRTGAEPLTVTFDDGINDVPDAQ